MKPELNAYSLVSDFVIHWWTPLFLVVFAAIVAYALWPRNAAKFDAAARMPLED